MGGAYPALGSGGLALFPNNWTSECKGTFPVTPGQAYQLTSQHYLWLVQNSEDCDSTEYWDPSAWYDYVLDDLPWPATLVSQGIDGSGYDWWSESAYDVTADSLGGSSGNWASQGLTETEQAINEYTGDPDSNDAGCTSETIVQNGSQTGVWELATTNATFTAISISPTTASFFQTQTQEFQSNLTDSLDWCIQGQSMNCANAIQGQNQELAYGATVSDTGLWYSSMAGSVDTFVAPNPANPQPVNPHNYVYMCVDESSNTQNYACAPADLCEISLMLDPPGETVISPNTSTTITARMAIPACPNYPASAIIPRSTNWNSWVLVQPAIGSGLSLGVSPSNLQSSYYYTASSATGRDTLSVSAS
jgi:hypothetical protein